MCTLTALPTGDARPGAMLWRVVINRDEKRERTPALPPSLHRSDDRRCIYPVDPCSGGTWIGVNDAGLTLALLNVNPLRTLGVGNPFSRSRGEIIPPLLRHDSVSAVIAEAADLDHRAFPPFRLVVIASGEVAVVRSDVRVMTVHPAVALTRPFFATSSGLGDHLVEQPRRRLFEETVGAIEPTVARLEESTRTQDAFHRHRWPDRPELSVLMTRDDAWTVSRTAVEVFHDRVRVVYEAVGTGTPVVSECARTARDGLPHPAVPRESCDRLSEAR